MSKPLLIAILGVSGSGKSTIAARLERKYGYISAKSYTTRPIRTECEGDELTHTFISSAEVRNYLDDIVAYNEYNGNQYFITNELLANSNLYIVDVEGLKQLYCNYHKKDIIAIFIDCDSSIAAKRMHDRGDSDDQIMQRLQYDAVEFANAKDLCDFVIPNEVPNHINDIVDWIDGLYRYYRPRVKED